MTTSAQVPSPYPVISVAGNHETWPPRNRRKLPRSYPYSGEMEAWPIDNLVNKVQNDGPNWWRDPEAAPPEKPKPAQMDLF